MDAKQIPTGFVGSPPRLGEPTSTGDVKAQARRLGDAVKERAIATSEDKKEHLSEQVGTIVQKLDDATRHEAGAQLSMPEQLVDRGLQALRRFQRTLEENSTQDLIAKAERQIRNRPGAVIAGCLALGFIGARLIRK